MGSLWRTISVLGIGGCLVFSGMGRAGASVRLSSGSQDWLKAWPMAGHDPQRTSRSLLVGPSHPRLVFSRKHFYLRLIGPDGRLYGKIRGNKSMDSVALTANGKVAVDYRTSRSPLALLPNGVLIAATPDEGQLHAYDATGKVLWAVEHVGLFKGAAPAATAGGLLFAPFVGHTVDMTAGLDVVSSVGQVVQRIEPGVSLWRVALSDTGKVYVLGITSQQRTFIEGLNPDGRRAWRQGLGVMPLFSGACYCIMVGSRTLYVASSRMLYAFSAEGTMKWRYSIAGGAVALAERSDGVLLAYGKRYLYALSPGGRRIWRMPLDKGGVRQFNGGLVVDAAGKAYVGVGSLGQVLVVSKSGKVMARVKTGRDQLHSSPVFRLSPGGELVVSGPNGTTRVYR